MVTKFFSKKLNTWIYDIGSYEHINYPQCFCNVFEFSNGILVVDNYKHNQKPTICGDNLHKLQELGIKTEEFINVERKLRFGRKNGVYTKEEWKALPKDETEVAEMGILEGSKYIYKK